MLRPKVTLEPDPIYVRDGHAYSSAGATSVMDLAIALVEEDFGSEFARRVAQGLVMFLRRPGNQAQFSVQVGSEISETGLTNEFQAFVIENLEGDLRVETLARHFGMSPRNFARVFKSRLGMAPGRYVEQCRRERARRYVEEEDESLSEISSRCGYATPDGLRLAFGRNLGVTPSPDRQRFSSSDIAQV
jgi:transcriptional regulator GlxA family with amidase domain